MCASMSSVVKAVDLLIGAQKPLIVIGKGKYVPPNIQTIRLTLSMCVNKKFKNICSFFMQIIKRKRVASLITTSQCFMFLGAAYSGAEWVIRDLVDTTRLPFLPTPMGKGVVPDNHPLCVAAARSKLVK